MNSLFKPLDHADCVLKTTSIDIWQFSLSKPSSAKEQALLSDAEKIRAQRFHFDHHRQRFIQARSTLRRILAHYLKQPAQDILFEYNAEGKPRLDSTASSLQFNLSHSGDMALLAVGLTHPVGIDLEFFSARPYAGIGQHVFSPTENQALDALPLSLRPLAFFHIWAQKEALIKAIGLGLSYPTERITMPILPPTHQTIDDPEHHSTWTVLSFMPMLGCSAALCHHPEIQTIRYTKSPLAWESS